MGYMHNDKNPYAVHLGKLGGIASSKIKTEAKIKASQLNGRKGGRPSKRTKGES